MAFFLTSCQTYLSLEEEFDSLSHPPVAEAGYFVVVILLLAFVREGFAAQADGFVVGGPQPDLEGARQEGQAHR